MDRSALHSRKTELSTHRDLGLDVCIDRIYMESRVL